MKPTPQMRHLAAHGIRVRVVRPPTTAELLDEMAQDSDKRLQAVRESLRLHEDPRK